MTHNKRNLWNLKGQKILWQPVSVWMMLVLGISMLVVGCGKKADPFIPKKKISALVKSITARYEEGIISVRGELLCAEKMDKGERDRVRMRIEYAHYGAGNVPCATCPVAFGHHKVISAIPCKDGKFVGRFEVPERDGIYLLRVRVIGDNGELGPPSEKIRVETH